MIGSFVMLKCGARGIVVLGYIVAGRAVFELACGTAFVPSDVA